MTADDMICDIDRHVLKYPRPVRVKILVFLITHREYVAESCSRYPLEMYGEAFGGYRIVVHSGSSRGFTLDGWIDALWAAL